MSSQTTAPLPSAARDAIRRLEAAFADRSTADRLAHEAASHVRVTPEIERAVTRYGICRDTLAELDGQRIATPAQFNALATAQDGLAEARATLAAAGQLHLVEA
jgi:uncharacterized lipoprotein NlpE involved in copper resistance